MKIIQYFFVLAAFVAVVGVTGSLVLPINLLTAGALIFHFLPNIMSGIGRKDKDTVLKHAICLLLVCVWFLSRIVFSWSGQGGNWMDKAASVIAGCLYLAPFLGSFWATIRYFSMWFDAPKTAKQVLPPIGKISRSTPKAVQSAPQVGVVIDINPRTGESYEAGGWKDKGLPWN